MKAQYIKINENGDKFYFSDKAMQVYHREDGPACEWSDGTKLWYRDGKRHREDGPACEWYDGGKSWFIDGKYMTQHKFKLKTAPCNGKKVTVDGVEYTLRA